MIIVIFLIIINFNIYDCRDKEFPLFWWEENNFGDNLSPIITERILDQYNKK